MNDVFYGNTFSAWVVAAGIAAAVIIGLYGLRYFIKCRLVKLAGRTETKVDDILLEVLGSTYFAFIVLAGLYAGSLSLALPDRTELILSRVVVVLLLAQAALWGDAGIRAWREHSQDKHGLAGNHAGVSSVGTLFFMARMVLWIVIALMVLDNLGVNITTLVASLGVGGIAVALAVQNVLGDLFASLSIVLDKPFVVGDTIIVGDAQGTVEYIGVKTTRLRSLTGEQIVFSNAELLKSRIHNQQRMVSRRAAFSVGVTYDTTREQLQAIPGIVKAIIEAEPNATFDRAHFSRFGESSLDFDVVYHIKSAEYLMFMDTQQSIFLKLFEQFGEAGIGFAYPTRVIKLDSGDAREPDEDQDQGKVVAPRRAPYEVLKPR
jgi:small-conductance mechanosensitive channel